MNRYVQSTVMSCSILAGVIFLATSLSAQAPAGGAPAGAASGGVPAMGGFGGGMGGGMPGGMGGFGGGAPGAGAGGAPAMGGFGGFGGGAPGGAPAGGAAPGGMGGFGGFGGGQGGMPPMGGGQGGFPGFGGGAPGGQGGMPRMGGMGGGMPRMGGMGGMGGGQPRDVKPEKREKMESIASTRTEFPDNKFKDMPQEYTRPNEKAGKIVSFKYKTRNHKTEGSAETEKTCLVYLPAGYDEKDTKTQYNILYLMHGAGGNESTFFRGEGQNTPLKNTFDNMIAKGDIKPLIVVTPTLGSVDALDFHSELVKDLIPTVEKQYHTYAKDVTAEGVHASKWHRAFGGFSLGGVTTWAVFDHCIDQIGCYIPISGDSWIAGQFQGAGAAKYLAETFTQTGYKPTDFRIYSGCGSTSDMANRNLTPQIDAMKNYPDIFKYCDNFKDGNLYLAISEKSGHDNTTIMNTLYNGLPKMFE